MLAIIVTLVGIVVFNEGHFVTPVNLAVHHKVVYNGGHFVSPVALVSH